MLPLTSIGVARREENDRIIVTGKCAVCWENRYQREDPSLDDAEAMAKFQIWDAIYGGVERKLEEASLRISPSAPVTLLRETLAALDAVKAMVRNPFAHRNGS